MIKVEAIVREEKLEDVKEALSEIEVHGITIYQVMGCGKQKGYLEIVRGQEVEINMLPKIKFEIVVSDENWEKKTIEAIQKAAYTGHPGDGKIISFDTREIRNEKTILMFSVTDFTDTITVKMFVRNDQLAELLGDIKKGAFVKIKGVTTIDKFDGELTIGSVTGIKKIGDFTVSREDLSPVKRVELHCHTKMSDMDGVSEVKSIVKRAHDWGHPAIAITDHGVAQSFPDANHYIETLDKDDPFKVIYGVEGYVVDDLTLRSMPGSRHWMTHILCSISRRQVFLQSRIRL